MLLPAWEGRATCEVPFGQMKTTIDLPGREKGNRTPLSVQAQRKLELQHTQGKVTLRTMDNKITNKGMRSLSTKCKTFKQSHIDFTIGIFKILKELMQE